MPGGSVFWTSSSAARTAFATATAFEPGCFRMPIAWTGVPFERAIAGHVLEAVLDERDVAELDDRRRRPS